MAKDVNTLEGVFEPLPDKPGFSELNMDRWESNIEKSRQIRGRVLVERLIKYEKGKIRRARQDMRWYRKTIRRLNRLVNSNPKEVCIYQNAILNDPQCGPNHWIDLFIATPNFFGKPEFHWITTFATKLMWESDVKDTQDLGGHYNLFDPKDPEEKFDQMYFDIPAINSPEVIVDCYKRWSELFLPELKDIPIRYVEDDEEIGIPWLKKLKRTIRRRIKKSH